MEQRISFKMKIGIIGNGFVGKATKCLKYPGLEMLCYDINPELCEPKGLQLSDLVCCEVVFISVPTPMNSDGSVCLSIVRSVVKNLRKENYVNAIVVRSTVPPGTCDELKVYFMPEFLTEKNYIQDFIDNPCWIFGYPQHEVNGKVKTILSALLKGAQSHGKIKSSMVRWMPNQEAELVKYFRNTFLALKVAFCNEIYSYCEAKQINYNNVQEVATMDPRIGPSHAKVPGPDGKRGYGGTCFPKDTHGLSSAMQQEGVSSLLLQASIQRNETIDRPEKDWLHDIGRTIIETTQV